MNQTLSEEREPLTQDGIDCWRINYGLDKPPHDLHAFWINGAPPGAALALKAAIAEIDRMRAENARLRGALAYALDEADGWHDDSRGGPIQGDSMIDAGRALLRT